MSGKHWTKEEEQYLIDNWGKVRMSTLTKKLHRGSLAISQKVYNMGIGTLVDNAEGIPIADLPDLIGVDYRNIHKTWIKDNGMKVTKITNAMSVVSDENLAKFMQAHPNLWIPSNCDAVYFSDYEWFRKALEDEKNGILARTRKEWTLSDIATLKRYRDRGMTFSEIGKIMGRTKSSCCNKYRHYYGYD